MLTNILMVIGFIGGIVLMLGALLYMDDEFGGRSYRPWQRAGVGIIGAIMFFGVMIAVQEQKARKDAIIDQFIGQCTPTDQYIVGYRNRISRVYDCGEQ